MPLYALRCEKCAASMDVYRSIARMNADLPSCCGVTMGRVITAPHIQADLAPYRSMATGEMIEGRAAHRAHLKKHGLIEVGNEKLPEAPRTVRGDFNPRRELTEATRQVLAKARA